MTKDELYNLLDELSLPDSIIGRLDAHKWCFWQRKGQIQENEVFLLLREYIEQRTKQADTNARENTYSVFAKLLFRTFELEHCQFLIDRLKVETNKYVLHSMLSGISHLQLPEGIDEIHGSTFEGCINLRSIAIPKGVTRIGGSAFRDCYKLEEIYLPEDVFVNGRAFKGSGTKVNTYYVGGYRFHQSFKIEEIGDSIEIDVSNYGSDFQGGTLKLLSINKKENVYVSPYTYELMYEFNGEVKTFVLSNDNKTYQISNNAVVTLINESVSIGGIIQGNDYTTGYNDISLCCNSSDYLNLYVNYN